MEFDAFTIVLLVRRDDAPALDDAAAAALQDAHMSHLADMQADGALLAAGPLLDDRFRGLCIYRSGVDDARERAERDPAVRAGRFTVTVIPWNVPKGVVAFPGEVTLPRSIADVS